MEQIELNNTDSHKARFQNTCLQNGLQISDVQVNQFVRYVEELKTWNQKINLISRKDEENIWNAHVLHSASLLFFLKFPAGASVLDLGTGSGLPGIPLKILMPDLKITLLDSTKKKIDAVADMVRKLELNNIHTVWGRAEDVNRKPEYSHKTDIIVARAVAPLSDLLKWSVPFLNSNSEKQTENLSAPALVTLKGGDLQDEVRAIQHHKRIKNIRIIDIVFKNINAPELQGKKIVVVDLKKE
ncbi:MAG TPA: 16S rRNA (guanine(527)-N(7))-methyltransferase RsmG [Bacteroidota bacterium]|nr:16S rRNA (guanine(527)-N(7))-methyltransferase RsmG [Bacteroidota bacterium]